MVRNIKQLIKHEAAGGVLLLGAAVLALFLANSAWSAAYLGFWQLELGGDLAGVPLRHSLEWLVNDGLMAVFFFQVGLEIRIEQAHGQLSDWRRASLPVAAALGGMLVPAAIYLMLAGSDATHSGWGVPMATDIAFALGVMGLLGKRIPPALRVLLLAVAVIDDLGAILVIAFFYSQGVSWLALGVAVAALGSVVLLRRLGVETKLAYLPSAVLAWGATYAAGVHPTIAGVALGVLTPVIPLRPGEEAPAAQLIHALHPWVTFAIMPIFALANAGVVLASAGIAGDAMHAMTGVAVGLLVGKPLGVLVASGLVLKLGVASMPQGVSIAQLVVLGVLAGIGFTMALFIAKLAFSDALLLDAVKLGVMGASLASGLAAYLLGRWLLPRAAG